MRQPEVTVAIPTRNRARLLRACLESVLAQTYPALRVLVLDNASEDATAETAASFAGDGLTYLRHESNIGMVGNWNRALELNGSPYVCVFGDDDLMRPDFVAESVAALEESSGAGFSFTRVELVDEAGDPLEEQDPGPLPDGCASGLDYLHRIAAGQRVVVNPSSVLMRASAAEAAGGFSSAHSRHTFDFNLYIRLAARFDVVLIPEALVRLRVHADQLYDSVWRSGDGTGPFTDLAERLDALAYLVESPRAAEPGYRDWLARRVRALNARRSEAALRFVPELHSWEERTRMAASDVAHVVPPGEQVVVADDGAWDGTVGAGRIVLPFVERDGTYAGPPPDDETAISELDRMRAAGARFLVVGWPAFWWLDYYSGFDRHLRVRYACVLENERLAVFDLR